MGTLTLNDGTVLQNSYALLTKEKLFLYIGNGMNLVQIVTLLSDQNKVNRIIYSVGENQIEYNDFRFVDSAETGVNNISVGLIR